MDEEEFETEEWVDRPSRRFKRADLIVLTVDLLRGISATITETLEMATTCAAAHVNWQIDRDTFHEEAALEIESLTTGEDE